MLHGSGQEKSMMKRLIRTIYRLMVVFGFDLRKTIYACIGLPSYLKELIDFRKQQEHSTSGFSFANLNPCFEDKSMESGAAKGHYFHQDLLVARRIYENNPKKHVDIGSRVDGFVAHVASFRRIQVIDIRPQKSSITNIEFICADLMSNLDANMVDYCDSLSCLHALEHFGLGRYGDKLKYEGYKDGLDNLHKILIKGGKLYLSVPIGPQRIEFNAHRVFSLEYLLELLMGRFNIQNFSYVDDNGELHENNELRHDMISNNYGCYFGCGIFEMEKI